MEPIEESTTLSPKESIVNILGRLFNNGHISGDELAMMQMELVARNPEPAPEPVSMNDSFLERMLLQMRGIDVNYKREPQGLGVSYSRPDTTMFPELSKRYPLGTKTGPASWIHGYVDANKLIDIFKDESI